jgi:hypothetical protein
VDGCEHVVKVDFDPIGGFFGSPRSLTPQSLEGFFRGQPKWNEKRPRSHVISLLRKKGGLSWYGSPLQTQKQGLSQFQNNTQFSKL